MTLTEEQRGTVAFDLEKARAEVATASARRFSESREQARIFCAEEILPDALDEIERLRPFEIAARDLDSDLGKIAGERDEQAARIKSLKKEIRRLKHESKVEQELTNSYIKHLHEAEARIKELEDALVEERARGNHYGMSYEDAVGDGEFERWIIDGEKDLPKIYLDRVRVEAKRQLRADGKIGPDADHIVGPDQMVPNGKIWQITEERKMAVCAMTKMLAAIGCQSCHNYIQKYYSNHIAVLRAMLEEAEQ